MSDVIHVVPGILPPELESAGFADPIFDMGDRLSMGPLFPIVDAAEWKAKRLAFWRRSTGDERAGLGGDPAVEDHVHDESCEFNFIHDPSALVGARTITLWLEPSLNSQLTLAWIPALLRAVGASPERIELVQSPLGAPYLEPFAAHPPPMTLSPEDLAELGRVWDALAASEPDALVAVLRSDYAPLPLFKPALRWLLPRYPEARSGVNTAERLLLEASRDGTLKAARVIGEAMDALYKGPDRCGDEWLFRRLLRLGDPSLPHPALALEGSTEAYRFVKARLTPFGASVLAGEANFVDANGIDDWVAGVHLQSAAGRVWFHDEGRLVRRP
jgi:hypothetical protein